MKKDKNEATLETARAWKRLLLNQETGEVRPDGKVVLRDLMKQAQFFGRQYELGNHDRNLELAIRRQTVIHILACLEIDEAKFKQALEIGNDD